jgi:hypothetical protein
MFVCCVCCVLSGRGICNELITRPEESYRLWRVVVCDQETSWTRGPKPALGCSAKKTVSSRLYDPEFGDRLWVEVRITPSTGFKPVHGDAYPPI